ncbi:UvrB/UvrC motif-containing protein [Elusimicrobiota bacterium]
MECEICHSNEATVFITKIENDNKVEYGLCEECASEIAPASIDFGGFQKDLLSSLSDMLVGFSDLDKNEKIVEELKCPGCGALFIDFQETGRLGCSLCYKTFADKLMPLLNRLQGSIQHAGKSPVGIEQHGEIERLKMEIQTAIEKEEYERAAVIRDKIEELEKKAEDETE